jgi:hypothetical protein
MTLERFQQTTVDAAVDALSREDGSKRFLIADEVGLGKTVSAKAIAAELQRRKNGTLNIVYLCPNLDIASQNLTKLRALQPDWPSPEDRLSLVLREKPDSRGSAFRIYSYTPDTSLPGWKPGQRTGRAAERDLIIGLLKEVAPQLWQRLCAIDRDREKEGERRLFSNTIESAPAHLKRPFEAALRELTTLTGKPFDIGLQALLKSWGDSVPELILRCRAALALVALRHPATRPDILILDEFHRYADLIVPAGLPRAEPRAEERHFVQRKLVDALIEGNQSRPAILLLSATPYRLQRLDRSEIPGGRYSQFIQLVRFLHGQSGAGLAEDAEVAIEAHHNALSRRDDVNAALADVAAAKRRLETSLRPVIARTERATAISGELFERRENVAAIEAGDLTTFRHLAHAVDVAKKAKRAPRSWVQPLWSSVPYPAETLFQYQLCKALGSDLPSVTIASTKHRPAHPQLRSLVDHNGCGASTLSLDALTLPWLAPTRPWWSLGGKWAELASSERLFGKALLFSRYRGTPPAVASWLSGEVEMRSGQRKATSKARTQSYLRPDAKAPWPLIAMFMPFPKLSEAFDPEKSGHQRISNVRRAAQKSLKSWLEQHGFDVVAPIGPSRKAWRLAFDIEGLLDGGDKVSDALWQLRRFVKPRGWQRKNVSRSITKDEISSLADWMLGSPGMIVARTIRRHPHQKDELPNLLPDAFDFCWRQLRPYLGQRYFASVVLGARRRKIIGGYPEALRQALLDGCLEATLDEHVAVTRLVGDAEALDILNQSLVGRPGRVQRRTTRGTRTVRVHAAAPYMGAERRNTGSRSSEKLRSDTLRKGFNSPFWPHVLATTSVGQEGLDFHVWCDRVIHWDLPRDPVDFEQREGRVSRYASLGVRRALADKFGNLTLETWSSPFQAIFDAARAAKREGLGLERWWSPTNHKPVSVTFAVPFSRVELQLRRLREDLVRYRLALGQPEPQLFEAMIEHFGLDHDAARALALNLSPGLPP